MSLIRFQWLVCSAAGLFVILAHGSVAAVPPVEGDRAVLDLLLAAQDTNQSLYPRGQLSAEVSNHITGTKVTTTVLWDGEKTHWNFDLRRPLAARPGRPDGTIMVRRGQLIETSTTLMGYWVHDDGPDYAVKKTDHRPGRGYEAELKVRPQDIWFRKDMLLAWRTILDPEQAHEGVTRYVVRREDADRVIVERHHDRGGVIRVAASLSRGGNVVAYTQLPSRKGEGFWSEGSFDWAQDRNGNWYLTRFAYKSSSEGDPQKPGFDYELRVTDFNPDPVIPRDRFEFSSLKPARGTIMEEKGRTSRLYQLGPEGREDRRIDQKRLDALSETLRDRGFAAPRTTGD